MNINTIDELNDKLKRSKREFHRLCIKAVFKLAREIKDYSCNFHACENKPVYIKNHKVHFVNKYMGEQSFEKAEDVTLDNLNEEHDFNSEDVFYEHICRYIYKLLENFNREKEFRRDKIKEFDNKCNLLKVFMGTEKEIMSKNRKIIDKPEKKNWEDLYLNELEPLYRKIPEDQLDDIKTGDQIWIIKHDEFHGYQVDSQRVNVLRDFPMDNCICYTNKQHAYLAAAYLSKHREIRYGSDFKQICRILKNIDEGE